jgi:truncated hemoglobin YjbI
MSFRPEGNKVHLHWASTNHQPCFCNPVISLDLTNTCTSSKLNPSQETIAAIFGVTHPEWIQLRDHDDHEEILVPHQSSGVSKLEPEEQQQHSSGYQVHVVAVAVGSDNHNHNHNHEEEETERRVPIHGIFALFPGDTDDDKSDRIQQLSENFYDKIWNDPETPSEFRNVFFSRSSSASIQAFRQYDWFHEVFGGPAMARAQEQESRRRRDVLRPKVMAKHTKSRMTRQHAMTWLHIMKRAVLEEFPNDSQLQSALGLYWLHFFGFFPYTDEDRKEFRRIVFGNK